MMTEQRKKLFNFNLAFKKKVRKFRYTQINKQTYVHTKNMEK